MKKKIVSIIIDNERLDKSKLGNSEITIEVGDTSALASFVKRFCTESIQCELTIVLKD